MARNASSSSPAVVSPDERQRLLRLAYRLCWNLQDAEDVLQDALLAAARHAGQLRERDRRWPWLCRIVVQHCHLHARRRRGDPAAAVGEPEAPARSEGGTLTQQELGTLMKRLLLRLPEQQRIALTLRHLEQMDYRRIAEVMRVSESTARTHVRAGREAMRRMILARHPEWQP